MNDEWLVVATKPQQETRAEVNLRRQAVESVYCPRVRVFGKLKALFPSYLFVQIANDNLGFIQNTYGVRSLIKLGETPATVSSDQIEEIRSRENNGIVVLECKHRKGDALSWGTIPVIFDEMVDIERCRVLFSMLGKSHRKILRFEELSPAN